uniref:Uncharacterized protein n=1 Tax=Avena sativa TaxID=4498 RepID=A0ACD5YXS2_AVESA
MLHCRSPSAAAAAQLPPLEDENLLGEILLRLPPLPSSLPRASLVCKRWLGVVSEPRFFRSFREHHGKPPLLGFFFFNGRGADFVPALDPPDRIPAARFSLPPQSHREQGRFFLGCRHGRCLFIDFARSEAILCDPTTSHQRRIALPPEFIEDKDRGHVQNGGVLPVAGSGHLHGDCSLSPFKLVLLYIDRNASNVSVSLYESESGLWGNIVSKSMPGAIGFITPSIQVGNAIYWGSQGGSILEFDVENQSLGVTEKPANNQHTHWSCYQLLRTQENGLGLLVLKTIALERPIIEIWAKKVDSYGTAQLVLQKTVELHKLLPLGSSMNILPQTCCLRGFDEEDNAIFLSLGIGVFKVNIETLQVGNISARPSTAYQTHGYYPYRSFYTAAVDIHRGTEGTTTTCGRRTSEDAGEARTMVLKALRRLKAIWGRSDA